MKEAEMETSMKKLVWLGAIALGMSLTTAVRPTSLADIAATVQSTTLVSGAQAQSRPIIRCVKGGWVNGRFYCNVARARARGRIR